MTETWLPCREFPDYEVSSEGRIRNIYTGRILKTNINDKGYEIVCLRKDGKQYTRKIHRLVADAFHEQYYEGLDVTHVDGNKARNKAENLEWRFRSDIMRRSFRRHGRKQTHRMKRVRVVETGEVFDSIAECSAATGVNKSSISKCMNYGSYYGNRKGYHFEPVDW
jgi:hypothetical protein